MSIRKRTTTGGTRWDVIYREGGRQRSLTFDTRKEALDFEAERRRTKRMGVYGPREPSSMTLGDWLTRWEDNYSVEWSPRTKTQRKSAVKVWIRPAIGHVPLSELGRSRIIEWRAAMMGKTTALNANNVLAVLSAALGAAASEDLIPYNPCQGVKKLRVRPDERSERRAFELDDVEYVLSLIEDPIYRLRGAVMGLAGLRPAEAAGVRWQDVVDDYIVVARSVHDGKADDTKTTIERRVPVFDRLRPYLDVERRGEWLTPGVRGGPANHRWWSRNHWSPATRNAGIYMTPYELRHSFATWLLRVERVDPVQAAAWMGHSPRVLLDTYSHVTVEPRRAARQ
jgi:integrase